ncbi:MAG: ADP-ribosylglycohydrolase family protein [Thermoanaerobaculia bacterium]
MSEALRDRYRGTLLGLFAGDALGMPVEGWPLREIRARFSHQGGQVRELEEARLGAGTYTDDTQMALALGEALLASPDSPGDGIDLDRVAACFAGAFAPERGYGGNTRRILAAVRGGTPWRRAVGEMQLPGGSWANGAAMRVAPVALAFYPDPVAVGRAAEAQAEVTGHSHPVGRTGARLQALAVLAALRRGAEGEALEPLELVAELRECSPGLPEEHEEALEWIEAGLDARPSEAVRSLGVSGRASESVPAALWAFLSCARDPEGEAEGAIVRAVSLGGDADTIGAMAGALAGAYRGASALPARWLDALEEGPRGRSYAVDLADRLYEGGTG